MARTTIRGILLTAIPCGLFAATPLTDRDWPWHLMDFERMCRERLAPWDHELWRDRFSYASEGEFLPVHWLFEVLLGLAHRALGLAGIELVRVGLVVLVFTLLHKLLARRGLGPLAASALALTVAAITRGRLLERPHLVTLLGIVLTWDCLLGFREGRKRALWPLVPIFWVWANSHVGVGYGAILATGFVVAEAFRMPRDRWRVLALVVLASLAATLVTPYGWRLYPYLLAHRSMQAEQHIAELRPFDIHRREDLQFVLALVPAAIIIVRAWRSGEKTDVVDLLATAGFIVLALVAPREANLALIAVVVTLAPALADTIKEARGELIDKDRALHVFTWGFALVLGFAMPAFALGEQLVAEDLGFGLGAREYPEAEAEWIRENKPRGRLWNSNASGGYLIWRLDPLANPEWQVFTDGRQPLFKRAAKMLQPEVDARFRPNIVVWDPKTPPYDTTEFMRERFVLVHFSDGGRTYLRRDGPDQELIQRFAFRSIWFVKVRNEAYPPTSPRHWVLDIAFDANAPREAKRELVERALREEPGGHWANLALARILLLEGDHAGAAQAARRALEACRSVEALEVLQAAERR